MVLRAALALSLLSICLPAHSDAERDWSGARYLSPVSARDLVLEAVAGGTTDGTVVSIGRPNKSANQKWIFVAKGDGWYSIRPSHCEGMALSVDAGGTSNGARLVLMADKGLDSQLWRVKPWVGDMLGLIPKHAQTKGMDDFGGGREPGAAIDIWDYNPGDRHLQWRILDSEEAMPELAPRGKIIEGVFSGSKIFPGTARRYWVYVPAQYNPAKPACVYVQQDGTWGFEAELLDELIADGSMPVTVGVFVHPGALTPPQGMDTPARPNRCFEYDGLGDNYVRFLTEELLPYVAKEHSLNLSTSGNDRCIGGSSSGGICSFNAAWERPDAFSRVYANSGSFVAFRGGHDFPIWVRKYEPKPIRAFLTTGTQDMENCAGDWTLIDLEMDKSLKFSGYEYVFHEIEGGHGVAWAECFPEAMRFLWKGWPTPVKPGPGAPRVQGIIVPDEGWKLVSDRFTGVGPACNSKGEVFFIDAPNDRICKLGLDGKVSVFLRDADHANSLSFGPNDELYAVSASTGRVMVYDSAAKGSVYADGVYGRYISARPEGGVYVTSPSADGSGSALWFVEPGGKTLVDGVGKRLTGVALSPDRWLLAAADGASKWIYSYQRNADGSVTNRERFFRMEVPDDADDAGIESLYYDREGSLYAATRLGIQVCMDGGPVQVILPVPSGRVTGICIGGPSLDTLFAFCGDKIYARKVKRHTLGAFTPWSRMTPGQL